MKTWWRELIVIWRSHHYLASEKGGGSLVRVAVILTSLVRQSSVGTANSLPAFTAPTCNGAKPILKFCLNCYGSIVDVLHCKYLQFLIVSTFHCNLAVRFTLIALSSPMLKLQ